MEVRPGESDAEGKNHLISLDKFTNMLKILCQNIEKAKKEIEKIEAEEAKEKDGKKSSSGAATPNGNGAIANGESADDKVAEVTKEVEEASIEDKEEEAVAAA